MFRGNLPLSVIGWRGGAQWWQELVPSYFWTSSKHLIGHGWKQFVGPGGLIQLGSFHKCVEIC